MQKIYCISILNTNQLILILTIYFLTFYTYISILKLIFVSAIAHIVRKLNIKLKILKFRINLQKKNDFVMKISNKY